MLKGGKLGSHKGNLAQTPPQSPSRNKQKLSLVTSCQTLFLFHEAALCSRETKIKLGFGVLRDFAIFIWSLTTFISLSILFPFFFPGRTAENLKAFLCQSDWWDHSFTIRKFNNVCQVGEKSTNETEQQQLINLRTSFTFSNCTNTIRNSIHIHRTRMKYLCLFFRILEIGFDIMNI